MRGMARITTQVRPAMKSSTAISPNSVLVDISMSRSTWCQGRSRPVIRSCHPVAGRPSATWRADAGR
ncbi:hypothetical protein ACFFX0_27230 [Citricoccus parietis]|uniref:Uncharacterized protein n=1 Tax=Citricoccus parietis TaxID=592307 RepID=A0ABV5G6W0_9MICC